MGANKQIYIAYNKHAQHVEGMRLRFDSGGDLTFDQAGVAVGMTNKDGGLYVIMRQGLLEYSYAIEVMSMEAKLQLLERLSGNL